MNASIRVVLADDHPLVRMGIRAVLSATSDIVVVGETRTTDNLVQLCVTQQADVLVLDINMPGLGVVDCLRTMQRDAPGIKTILLSGTGDATIARQGVTLGAVGYVLKAETAELLVHAIRTVVRGATYYSKTVLDHLLDFPKLKTPLDSLTLREVEILQELAKGRSNAQIALHLHLAKQTVRNYTTRIYDKLGVESRAAAVVWAQQHGVDRISATSI